MEALCFWAQDVVQRRVLPLKAMSIAVSPLDIGTGERDFNRLGPTSSMRLGKRQEFENGLKQDRAEDIHAKGAQTTTSSSSQFVMIITSLLPGFIMARCGTCAR